jgi:hypothetical protein
MDQTEALFTWLDREVGFGSVVAVGSRCACGKEATVALHSPRWGDWDVCSRCAVEQFVALHGLWSLLDDLCRVTRQATSSIQLDMMLGGSADEPVVAIPTRITMEQANKIREAWYFMDGPSDRPKTVPECWEVIEEMLELVGVITGITNAAAISSDEGIAG